MAGRIVRRGVTRAGTVNEEGKREGLGAATGLSEAAIFRTGLQRSLAERGVNPVIAAARTGLRAIA